MVRHSKFPWVTRWCAYDQQHHNPLRKYVIVDFSVLGLNPFQTENELECFGKARPEELLVQENL